MKIIFTKKRETEKEREREREFRKCAWIGTYGEINFSLMGGGVL